MIRTGETGRAEVILSVPRLFLFVTPQSRNPGMILNGNLLSEELEHSPAPEASTPRTTHVGDANPRHGFKLTIHLVYQRQAAP